MKKIMCWGILFVSLVAFWQPSEAAPANPEVVTFEQPSGETFKGQLKGDESLNYFLTEQGEVIEKNEKDNYWYYLEENTNRSTSEATKVSTVKVGDTIPSNTVNEELFIQTSPKNETFIEQETATSKARIMQKKEQNLLVLLVEFDDVKLKYSDNEWGKLIFGNEAPSLKNYYTTNTKGRIEVVPAEETSGTSSDGIIRVSLEGNHPNTAGNTDERNQKITKQALIKAQLFIDYKQYDTNGNGKLEADELHIMVIVAGKEASYGYANDKTVWGHKWSLQNQQSLTLDGLKFNTYTQFGEVHSNHQATVGVIAHEFGHDLGLPDLYNTGFIENDVTIKNGVGLGYTSLMASGSWGRRSYNEDGGTTPAGLDAYSKSILGMGVETITTSVNDKLVQTLDEGEPTILRVNSKNNNEYFLMENRQFSGYDEGMSIMTYSGGIAIYRVNTNYAGNYTKGKQLVTSVEADEGIRGYSYFSQNQMFNSADPFYYNGTGLHGKEQQVVLSKTTTPSTAITDGSTENFKVQVKSNPENKMYIDLQMIEPVEGTFGTTPWEWDEETQTITFGGGEFPECYYLGAFGAGIKKSIENDKRLKGKKIKQIEFQNKVKLHSISANLFNGLAELENIKGLKNIDTTEVTNMFAMFANTDMLKELDLINWNTSNVTIMTSMFSWAKSLQNLDVTNWDTSNVKYMENMFDATQSLQKLDVSNWNTSNVTHMFGMFSGAKSLQDLDVTNWDTSNVKYMSSMFDGMSSLRKLDVTNWNTSNVITMGYMFSGLNYLQELDVTNWDTSSVNEMQYMFAFSKSLKEINVSNWNISNAQRLDGIFYGTRSLKQLDVSNWDTSYITSMKDMFVDMPKLQSIVLGTKSIFNESSKLKFAGNLNGWVNSDKTIVYNSTADFLAEYDGTYPDTYSIMYIGNLKK